VRLFRHDESDECNFQYVVLEVDEPAAGLTRDELYLVLRAENVLARRYFHPGAHRMEPYASCFPHAGLLLPTTERLCARVLSLPTGSNVSRESVTRICRTIAIAIQNAARVRARIRERGESQTPQ
jgi:dTDP-4-amino-4,6-dideoxygalactose transaminase